MSAANVVVVSGNPGSPSRTRVLLEAILEALVARADIDAQLIELSDLGPVIGQHHARKQLPAQGEQAIAAVEGADLLVVASPVYRGSYTGLFKHLFDLVGLDALVGKPVILAATGGSDRHALVIDHQLRPLFAFFRALTVPTGVYAAEADFEQYRLVSDNVRQRIQWAVEESLVLLPPAVARSEAKLRAIA